jgi:uncharacterized protein (DUF1330 family)
MSPTPTTTRNISPPTRRFEQYGARFIVRGGQGQVFEGPAATRLVIIEFDSYQTALDCYHSPDYQVALKVRHAYSNAHFAIVEGV